MSITIVGTTGVYANTVVETTPISNTAIYVSAATRTNLTNNVWTKVTLDSETTDANSTFTASRFTPTVAGYYLCSGSVQANVLANYVRSAIYKNGTIYRGGYAVNWPTANASQSTISTVVYMNGTTDYIELYGKVIGTGSIATSNASANTYLTACRLDNAQG